MCEFQIKLECVCVCGCVCVHVRERMCVGLFLWHSIFTSKDEPKVLLLNTVKLFDSLRT